MTGLVVRAISLGRASHARNTMDVTPVSTASAIDRHPRRRVKVVLETEISYVDVGHGHPVVFLHGNVTWSYVWGHIIPYVVPHDRCLAPAVIGMGQSGQSGTRSYRLADLVQYLDAWFEARGLTSNVTIRRA